MHRRLRRSGSAVAALLLASAAACSSGDGAGDGPAPSTAPPASDAPAASSAVDDPDLAPTPETTEPVLTNDTIGAATDTEPSDSLDDNAASVDADLCEDPDAAAAPIEGPIKIGTSLPLSGGPAVLLAPIGRGQQAYIDFYNNEFGGVDDRELELIVRDDQSTPELTAANVSELVLDDEVAAIAGVVGAANNLAIADQLNTACVPHLFAVSGASALFAAEVPWTIALSIPHRLEAAMWVEYVAANGGESLGLFVTADDTGLAYQAAVEDAAAVAGLDITGVVTVGPAAATVPAELLAQLAATEPDAVFAAPLGAQCTAFMTGVADQRTQPAGFADLVYLTASCATSTLYSAVGNGGDDGVFTATNTVDVRDPEVLDDSPAVQDYLDAFERVAPQEDAAGLALVGWLSMELTVAAIQHASDDGDLSRFGIITAARNTDAQPSVLRAPLVVHLDGTDRYAAEGAQLVRWSTEQGRFVDVGALTNREGALDAE